MADETLWPDDPGSGTNAPPARPLAANEPDAGSGVEKFVESLPKWRDGVLVLAGLAYVLGYLSWAFYAMERGLGLASVLDAQYFAAGILPLMIVAAACFVAWWLRRLSQWTRKPVSGFGKTAKRILDVAGTLFILAGFVLLLISRRAARIPPALESVADVLIFAGVAAAVVSSFFSREKSDAWYHRLVVGLTWFYLPFVGIAAFLLYTTKVFPGLPQALGGPQPQCIQLDMDVSKLSTNTLHLLAPQWQAGETNEGGMVRSRNLYLIFQSGEYLFVQTGREGSLETNQVFRLKSGTVEGVFPVVDAVSAR